MPLASDVEEAEEVDEVNEAHEGIQKIFLATKSTGHREMDYNIHRSEMST